MECKKLFISACGVEGNPDEGQIEERIYQVVLLSNDIRGRSYPSLALPWIQKRGKIDISI